MTSATALTYILIVTYPMQGQWVEQRWAAADRVSCEAAAGAWLAGRGLPLNVDGPAREARCVPGNMFAPGWDCIVGFNCR